jgi:hypothetical protein
MKITVTVDRRDYLAIDVLDYLVGYWQYQSDYTETPDIVFGEPSADTYNILFLSMPETVPTNLDQFDLVLVDNTDEPFGRGTQAMYDIIDQVPHARLLCNAILPQDHPMQSRIITTCIMWEVHRRFFLESIYPPRYEVFTKTANTKRMVYINGHNRANREYWTRLIKGVAPQIPHHNVLHNGTCHNTLFCWHESEADTKFRLWVNETYAIDKWNPNPADTWPELPAGIEGRYGTTNFGDHFIDALREHQVIIYNESQWQNHQLSLNEKSLKCFMHRKWAFPVAGAGIHRMYGQLGFSTAWQLLPPEHQEFDDIEDHQIRYQQQAQAVKWLYDNYHDVVMTEYARRLLVDNQARCVLVSSQAGIELFDIINETHR